MNRRAILVLFACLALPAWAADPGREAAFQRALALARAVKASANNPGSIEFFGAYAFADGTVALEYRGRNGFNGMVINRAVMTGKGKTAAGSDDSVSRLWNRYVANKDMAYDLTDAIQGAKLLHAL